LQASGNISVNLGGFDENEGELPSSNHFLPHENISSRANLQKFDASLTGDRSDFGFSQASSHFAGTAQSI